MDLISGLIEPDPKDRYGIKQVSKHPWMQGKTATSQEVQEEFSERYE